MLSHPILTSPSVKGDHPCKNPLGPRSTISIHPQICIKGQKMPSLIINHLQYKNPPVKKKNRHSYETPKANSDTRKKYSYPKAACPELCRRSGRAVATSVEQLFWGSFSFGIFSFGQAKEKYTRAGHSRHDTPQITTYTLIKNNKQKIS